MDLIRDPLIATFITMVTLVVALIIIRRRRLSYYVWSKRSLVAVRKDLADRLEIHFDGQPVSRIDIIVASVTNYGNVALDADDFEKPISISFGSNGDIVAADVTRTWPNDLKPVTHVKGNQLTIEPLLLNPRDRVEFTVFVSNLEGDVTADARVKGVKRFKRRAEHKLLANSLLATGIVLMPGGVIADVAGVFDATAARIGSSPDTIGKVVFFVGMVFILGSRLLSEGVFRNTRA